MNGKPKAAWDVYLSMESTADSFNILEIIGNDCYQMGQFFYALKAFEALEKVDNEKEYDEALRGSVIGVFQMVVANK
jgi:intraflagellar transport protein 56